MFGFFFIIVKNIHIFGKSFNPNELETCPSEKLFKCQNKLKQQKSECAYGGINILTLAFAFSNVAISSPFPAKLTCKKL